MSKVKVSKGHRAVVKPSNYANESASSNADGGSICAQIEACPIIQQMQEDIMNMEAGAADWNTLANKPASFPPTTHAHTIPDVTGLTAALGATASLVELNAAIADLKDGVPTAGDSLQKLYNLVITSQDQFTVADAAALAAFDVQNLNIQVFVVDDGDGNWALYKPTSTGVGATFIKISDPDLLNAVMSAAQIKLAYESNPDTNAFTNALKSKLDSISAIFTTALKDTYDTAASWVSVNGAAILAALLLKQDTLVSGSNIKTVNNVSILGAGNITVGATQAMRITTTGLTFPASSGNRFMPMTTGLTTATESSAQMVVEQAMTLKQIVALTTTTQSASGAIVLVLRKNGADTTLTYTHAAGAVAGVISTSADVTLVAGDKICWRINNAATATSANFTQFSTLYT